MPACEPLLGTRVIALPASLDTAAWPPGTVVRIAPDEALLLGDDHAEIRIDDEHAIIESDHGWAGAHLDAAALADLVDRHIEWPLPAQRPVVAQGQIAGVPAKLVLPAEGDGAFLLCLAALAHELEERVR